MVNNFSELVGAISALDSSAIYFGYGPPPLTCVDAFAHVMMKNWCGFDASRYLMRIKAQQCAMKQRV